MNADAQPPPLEVTATSDGAAVVLHVAGDIDEATVDTFTTAVMDLVGGRSQVIVDCSQITFIASAGLRALAHLRNEVVDARGGELVLRDASRNFRRMLDITGMGELFPSEPALTPSGSGSRPDPEPERP